METNNHQISSVPSSSSSKQNPVPVGKRAIDILSRKQPIAPPKMGMRFDTMDEAYEYFLAYGYQKGFGVTKRNFHTRNGVRYRYTLMCYKGGKPKNKPGLKVRRRLVAKTDCKAAMVVKFNNLQGNWEVVFLELEHNHPCNPEMVRFMMCFRDLPDWKNQYQPFNARTRLHPKIHAGRGRPARPKEYVERTLGQRNNFNVELGMGGCKWRFTEADVEALLAFFDRNQADDSSFYYSWDMDESGRLKNVLWVDPRSKEAYKYFNDVVCFDTIYLSEQYNIPLVAFLGVSHHGQVILLGCGLLGDDSGVSYLWLFKKWLKCMDDKLPGGVITSHSSSIIHAVSEAFPGVRRRFYLWHILKELPELSGRTEDKEAMSMKVRKVVFGSLTALDFERDWIEMIKGYNLTDNRWLSALFEERDKWVPAYIKEHFWAGLGTMHRSERLDHFFDGYITPETSIKSFVEQYDTAMRLRYDREMYDDFRSLQQSPDILSGLLFEDQIARVYTINVFLKFQDQVRQLVRVNCQVANRTGSMVTYTVTVIGKGKKLDYRVIFNSSEKEVWCICRSFQFKGILCSHALAVLKQELVMYIPDKYILDRWKKDYNRPNEKQSNDNCNNITAAEVASADLTVQEIERRGEEPVVVVNQEKNEEDPLYKHGHEFLADLAGLGAMDQDGMEYALNVMKEAKEKIMKKLEQSRGGATSAQKDDKERQKKKGKKGRTSSSGIKETGTTTADMIGTSAGNAIMQAVQPPPGIFYLPVRPHPMVFPPFLPQLQPSVPPVTPAPGASDSARKRRRRAAT